MMGDVFDAAYIKSYAIGAVRDGHSPAEAVKLAKESLEKRRAAEQAIEEEMSK